MKNIEEQSFFKQHMEKEHECIELIKRLNFSYEELLRFAASLMVTESELTEENEKLMAALNETERCLHIFANTTGRLDGEMRDNLLELFSEGDVRAARAILAGVKISLSTLGKKGANAIHNAKGGSREKAAKIRAIWASGKYSSRDLCAEQECAALNMSFSTARKALRGTPTPNRQ